MEKDEESKGERIAKIMARAGLCSRRDAERWIEQGRVSLNGKILKSPAVCVKAEDTVVVDGEPLPNAEKTRLFLFHKPAGVVTTSRDEKGRKTVFDVLPPGLPRVVTVGRLDLNTEGLLLLTNDGALSRYLELPRTGWIRRYRVRAHGHVTQKRLDSLQEGVRWQGVEYGPIEATIDETDHDHAKNTASNLWLTVALREGKNREVRHVMESLGLQVNRLIRTAYGPFQLGKLPRGTAMEINGKILKEQISGFFETAKKS